MRKLLFLISIFLLTHLITSKKEKNYGPVYILPQIFCDLSIRPFPLLYYGQTKNMDFRLLFLSSCLDYPLLFYFTLPYNHVHKLFVHTHPSFVRLKLFGRVFDFKFSDPYERWVFFLIFWNMGFFRGETCLQKFEIYFWKYFFISF